MKARTDEGGFILSENYEERLTRLRTIVDQASGIEELVDFGEIGLSDVQWLLENVNEVDIASGPIDWHIRPWSKNRIVIEMRSSVKPSTWLAMHVDQIGWQNFKIAGDRQLIIAKSMNT